jgi:hypothetical protein
MSRCLKLCTACVGRTCAGNFEIVDGMSVSTPCCQDENLAVHQQKRGFERTCAEQVMIRRQSVGTRFVRA